MKVLARPWPFRLGTEIPLPAVRAMKMVRQLSRTRIRWEVRLLKLDSPPSLYFGD